MSHHIRLELALCLAFALSSTCRGQCLQWQPNSGTDEKVFALASFDDGTGTALFAGGHFTHAGGVAANRVAKWDGSSWHALGLGVGNNVYALAVFDDGAGEQLYVAGALPTAGTITVNGIAKWDGSVWSDVAGGLGSDVRALTVFDDGTGPALFAGGTFFGGAGPMRSIAKLGASAWNPLGAGIMDSSVTSTVYCLTVFDDGTGPALYAGGNFDTAGGANANHIARWNGSNWSSLGTGIDGTVFALAGFDDGAGPALYAAGEFSNAGGVSARRIAKWSGNAWSSLGTGLTGVAPGPADLGWSLAVFDSGSGSELYAGGGFTDAGGIFAAHVARWNGSAWSALSSGTDERVWALTVFQDGTNNAPDLYAGGEFIQAGGAVSPRLAEWLGCTTPGVGFCFGDGTGAACPCDPGQAGSPGSGCRSSIGTGGLLDGTGHASVTSDTVTLVASQLLPSTVGLFFQGTMPQASGVGSAFGDGLLCVNGSVRRLGIRHATSGMMSLGFGIPGDPPISIAGAIPALGATRHYQLRYRDPPAYCTPSTFNLTNGLRINWLP
jgi:hypothetical protein